MTPPDYDTDFNAWTQAQAEVIQAKEMPRWTSNWDCFLAFAWQGPSGERLLVTVNYAPNQSQCYIRLPFANLAGGQWRLRDHMGEAIDDRHDSDV